MKTSFPLNNRHNIEVNLNSDSGLCDVVVIDRINGDKFENSLDLKEYNEMVEWFKNKEYLPNAVDTAHYAFGH